MAARYTERVKQGVESLINCLICTDRFSEPKVLPCQHTFCLPCLEHFYRSYNDQRIINVSNFPCPQCRKSVYMPQGGLAALPNDFKVGQIQEVFSKINIVGNDISCDICRHEDKAVDVTSFCAQCSKYLCEACTQQHARSTLFRTHSTVSIGSKETDDLICSQHNEVVKYFCLDCKMALCTVCALSKHSKHETIDLATAMDRNRTSVVQNVDLLKANLVLYENKAEKFATLNRGRQNQVEKLKETVKKHTRTCIAKLREDELKMYKEIDSITKHMEEQIEKEIHFINGRAKEIKSVCDKTDSFLVNGGSLELVNKYDNILKRLKEYAQPPEAKIEDQFIEELVLVPNTHNSIGSLSKVINEHVPDIEDDAPKKKKGGEKVLNKIRKLEKLANGNGTSISITPDESSVISGEQPVGTSESPESSGTSPNATPRSGDADISSEDIALETRDSYQGTIDVANTGAAAEDPAIIKAQDTLRLLWKTVDNAQARDVSFFANGTAVATEYREGSDKLQLFDPDGNLINCVACSAQNIIRPWGCAINHQLDQIIITDHGDRAVKVLDSHLALRQVWRSLFDKPCGVAVMRNGDYVITDVDKSAYMVSVHTPSGIRKREFANKGDGMDDLLEPYYVTADHHDRIIVSDAALHSIKIFDIRGKLLLKFQAANHPPLQPYGLCVDARNNIVVADQSSNTISLFSPDGQFIQHVAQMEEKPWGIAAHDNGSLAITTDSSLHMLYAPAIKTW